MQASAIFDCTPFVAGMARDIANPCGLFALCNVAPHDPDQHAASARIFQIIPLSVDRTVVRHGCCSRMDLTEPANAARFERIWGSAHCVLQKQDFPCGGTTAHPALAAGAMPRLVFGRNEWPLQILAEEVDRALAEVAG